MKKRLLAIVCMCITALFGFTLSAHATDNQTNTSEYSFDIVKAISNEETADANDILVRLYQNDSSIKSALAIALFYDDAGCLLDMDLKTVTDFEAEFSLSSQKTFSKGKVILWQSLSSLMPLAKSVETGFIKTVPYALECYHQTAERTGYSLYETKALGEAVVGDTITLDEASIPSYEAFSFDTENALNLTSGIVSPEGLTLKLYYNHIVDEAQLIQVIYRLEKVETKLNEYKGNFTDEELPIVKDILQTVGYVLTDADAGALIYIEGYVTDKYSERVQSAKQKLDTLKANGGYEDFKSKLTKYFSAADVEYLAKVMFGIDDIYQYG